MSSTHDRVRAILSEAETAIKGLIAQELDAGCYDQITMLARIGDTLSELAGTITGSPSSKANVIAKRKAETIPAPVGRSSGRAKPRQSTKAGQYPKFVRNGNKLVKIGWSKKSRKEYEHRAPREVLQAFAESLWGRIEPGRVFAMEEILPVHDSSGDELPDYQSYLALAWLRSEGAIEKVGRNGYVLAIQNMGTETFDALWNQLPEQH